MLDLQRFVAAQDPVMDQVMAQLRAGAKTTHWMWFIFPQIAGLGLSAMSRHYALSGRAEALAYLAHPVLGPRLLACTQAVLAVQGRPAARIFGSVDAQKFLSCMTLFAEVSGEPVFIAALERFFDGDRDLATLARL